MNNTPEKIAEELINKAAERIHLASCRALAQRAGPYSLTINQCKEILTATLNLKELVEDKAMMDWLETRPVNVENFSRQAIKAAMATSP